MRLTGQCESDFKKWYNENYHEVHHSTHDSGFEIWLSKNEIMLNQLKILFFDSVGIFIDCGYYAKRKMCAGVEGENFGFISTGTKYTTRTEAIDSALEKANEIYNQQQQPLKNKLL